LRQGWILLPQARSHHGLKYFRALRSVLGQGSSHQHGSISQPDEPAAQKHHHNRGTHRDIRFDRPPVLDEDLDPRRLRHLEHPLHGYGVCPRRAGRHNGSGLWHHLGRRSRAVPYRRGADCGVRTGKHRSGGRASDSPEQYPPVVASGWRLNIGGRDSRKAWTSSAFLLLNRRTTACAAPICSSADGTVTGLLCGEPEIGNHQSPSACLCLDRFTAVPPLRHGERKTS
jgi:hypothetical protein